MLKKIFFFLFIGLCLIGCSSKADVPLSQKEANQKLVQILENDYGYSPVLRWVGETLWIYLPSNNPIYKVEGSEKSSHPTKKKYTLQYIHAAFENQTFALEYDVLPATKVSSGNGMSTKYSEAFNEQYRNATTAISRTFFNAEHPPQFIALVIADIKDGLETKTVFCTLDLKKYYTGAIPPDEYALRAQTDPSGNPAIVDDLKGNHLTFDAISLPAFLAKQMAYRISFKFQNSDFPPEETPQSEILKVIATTTMIYDFHDYATAVLNDLRKASVENVTRTQIEALQDKSILEKEKKPDEGRVITIDFSEFLKNHQKESLPLEGKDESSLENQQASEPTLNTTP